MSLKPLHYPWIVIVKNDTKSLFIGARCYLETFTAPAKVNDCYWTRLLPQQPYDLYNWKVWVVVRAVEEMGCTCWKICWYRIYDTNKSTKIWYIAVLYSNLGSSKAKEYIMLNEYWNPRHSHVLKVTLLFILSKHSIWVPEDMFLKLFAGNSF